MPASMTSVLTTANGCHHRWQTSQKQGLDSVASDGRLVTQKGPV